MILPYVMQDRFMDHWDRLVESGIDKYVRRQTIDFYKSVRSEWFHRMKANKHVEEEASYVTDNGLSSELILFLLILICGHTIAGIAFAIELLWNSRFFCVVSMQTGLWRIFLKLHQFK